MSDAVCTCSYDWGGYCKHIVATLLTFVHKEDSVDQRPPITETLERLSRDQLQAIIMEVAREIPEVIELIEELALNPQGPGDSHR